MEITDKATKITAQIGFAEWGYVTIGHLRYYPEVRKLCEANTCRNYGTTWTCPPAVGTISQCRARVNQYEKMLLFSQVYKVEDSFDFEGMIAGLHDFKQMVDCFRLKIQDCLPGYLLLSNEGCGRCSTCTYPDAPCRFPQLAHHSLEGYGFDVSELAREAGVRYNNGPNTVTYFGALLFTVPGP